MALFKKIKDAIGSTDGELLARGIPAWGAVQDVQLDGTQVTMSAALRGLSDTRMPLVIALVGYWLVGFPVSYLFGFPLGLRGVGIWMGLAAGLAAVGLVLTLRWAMRERLGLTAHPPV